MPESHYTEHTITISAPAEVVYGVVADVTRWPEFFAPTVHAEQMERDDAEERIRLWAFANGEVKTWTSRRRLDPHELRIEFRQEVSQHPVASMGGEWVLKPLSDDTTEVVLKHDYSAVDDAPEHVAWIERAVDRNSKSELAALKTIAELHADLDELALTFDDSLAVSGSAEDVYEFLYRAQEWPQRVPHVARLDLREDTLNVQFMEMDTRTPDGSVHTTASVRVCFPSRRIVYKQVRVPKLMTAHTGHWVLEETAEGVVATSRHSVIINPANVTAVLGSDATVADARAFIRKALGTNSLTTLRYAKEYAEGRRG